MTVRKVGRPKNDDLQIFEDYTAFKIKHPHSGIEDICRFMIRDADDRCQGRYCGMKLDTVRKRLDRAIEGYVKESTARSLPKVRAEAERIGKPWTPQAEAKARKDIRASVMNGIIEGVSRAVSRRLWPFHNAARQTEAEAAKHERRVLSGERTKPS
jgi:hypothetical protein